MRLIDADALIRFIDVGHLRKPTELCFSELDVVNLLQNAPTIDAVPVVRCKDCEYYELDECGNPYIWMSDGARLYTQPDDFCSYGERKGGDE